MLLLAFVKDEELVRHLLFDLDQFTKWNSLSMGNTSLHAAATGEEAGGRDIEPLLVETQCRVGLLVIL